MKTYYLIKVIIYITALFVTIIIKSADVKLTVLFGVLAIMSNIDFNNAKEKD